MFGTYNRLNVRVSESNVAVIRAARRKLKNPRNPAEREARHNFYRAMLAYHASAQGIVREHRL